jgi:alcohol dehydrogenase class IV
VRENACMPVPLPDTEREFTWHDGERIVHFGAGTLGRSADLLAGAGWTRYELLTTPRALAGAPLALAQGASAVHEVNPGPVADLSSQLIEDVRTPTLIALGGGRVIDTAKAIAAVRGGRVGAVPTTLSGAEMTAIHRLPAGHEHEAQHLVRPAIVLADPDSMTGLGEAQLRASAMNSLAHGAEALYTPLANPVASLATLRGAELTRIALDQAPTKRDRAALALGSVLCAYALDSAGFALHHVVCQTLVGVFGLPHAETNATMLPWTMDAMRTRAPEAIGALAAALGGTAGRIRQRITTLSGGARRLSDLGADAGRIDVALDRILARAELAATPSPPDRAELRDLIEKAW